MLVIRPRQQPRLLQMSDAEWFLLGCMGVAMTSVPTLSVNQRSAALVARMIDDAEELRIGVSRGELGETLIDAGSKSPGGIAAGIRIAEICMGGLGQVELLPSSATPRWPWTLVVRSSNPVIACLASQYAGWQLADETGEKPFAALGSGPTREGARRERLFLDLRYCDSASRATRVTDGPRPRPEKIVATVA